MRATTILNGAIRSVLGPVKRSVLARACRRAIVSSTQSTELQNHLDAAYDWLCSAQDAHSDGGVAGCYNMVTGWGASYPETTGYIIPTFLHYGTVMRTPQATMRALRMADWEVETQLPTGAVRSGMMSPHVAPAVFNTGQVLFGWLSAFAVSGEEHHACAAVRACTWLTSMQDPDGAWRKCLSPLTQSTVQTYNVRTAWGLALAGYEFNEPHWINTAIRNCDWALTRQLDNGWFLSNGFSDSEAPLLHTIAYALEGLLGMGEVSGREEYVNAVIRGIDPLVLVYARDGSLKGRYDASWRPAVSYRCLTGEAQLAVTLLRLANLTDNRQYRSLGHALLEKIACLQDTDSPHDESRGGISGSEPIWGDYGPFNYLNWAAKFFMDGLLLDLHGVDVQDRPLPLAQNKLAA
jgi:hypothetical protein